MAPPHKDYDHNSFISDEGFNISAENLINTDKLKILIAEDNETNFHYLHIIFKQHNINHYRVENGFDAVKTVREDADINLIIMNIQMPFMDGYQACEIIKREKPNLAIIAQTAFTDDESIKKIRDLGFDAYISKPISKDKLFSMINNIKSNL